jgi:hypothetical protein
MKPAWPAQIEEEQGRNLVPLQLREMKNVIK